MIPTLTTDERRAALEKAMELRKQRASYRDALKDGTMMMAQLFKLSDCGDQAAADMRVYSSITALRDYGKTRTAMLMQTLLIAGNRRIKGIGKRQRERLLAALEKGSGNEQ